MAEAFIGEIRPVGFNFAPRGWATCSGQILPISQNTALFSLLGTFYGGNGTLNFGLPNLEGRIPLGYGQGPGLANRDIGEVGGSTSVTLQTMNLPPHSHNVVASSVAATSDTPVAHFPAVGARGSYNASSNGLFASDAVIADGGGQAHNNLQPYVTILYVIALQGIFPARS